MGLISDTDGLSVYVDSAIIIYFVERHPEYGKAVESFWRTRAEPEKSIFTSELSILESKVLPNRHGLQDRLDAFDRLFDGQDLKLISIDRSILEEAARLRALHAALRTPDAIHFATFTSSGADRLLANDARLAKLSSNALLLTSYIP